MRTIAASGLIALSAMLGVAASFAVAGPATAAQAQDRAQMHRPARAASTPDVPPPANELFGLSCPSSRFCVAVGLNQNAELSGGGALIQTWNGKTWKSVAGKSPKGGLSSQLLGVSCASASACVAVGVYLNHSGFGVPLVETWNGRTWTPGGPATFKGSTGGQLEGVSCATARSCVAVGNFFTSTGAAALAESWNGSRWTPSKPAEPKGTVAGELTAVSCPSAARCVAVGGAGTNTGSFALADAWNGKSWSRLSLQPPAAERNDANLTGVSCPSAKACVAVGTGTARTGRPGGLSSFAARWNGRTWTASTVGWPRGTSDDYLTGVSCRSAVSCLAVGQIDLNVNKGGHTGRAAAVRWNGKAWAVTAVPAPGKGRASLFAGVSCPTATACVAVGQLGPFNSDEGNGLAGFWNGRSWRLATT